MLGSFAVVLGGQPVTTLFTGRARALAYLVVESGRAHMREVLAGLACVALAQEDLAGALAHVQEITGHLEARPALE